MSSQRAGSPAIGLLAACALTACLTFALVRGSRPASEDAPRTVGSVHVERVCDFTLLDAQGVAHQLSHGPPWTVIYTTTAGCPVARLHVATLRELQARFDGRVRFLLLDPAPQDTRTVMSSECPGLTVLMDPSQVVAESLGVHGTAEAILIDTRRSSIVWRGPVDDGASYEGDRKISHPFLAEAIEAVLEGRSPPPAEAVPQGCAITFLEPREKHTVSYSDVIVPMLRRHCQSCHREGGMGPWAMSGWETVRGWSQMMKQVVLTRRMPPWNPDPAYGHFRRDLRLTDAELRALVHWIDDGAPRGSGPDGLATTNPPGGEWPMGPPDVVVDLPSQTIPERGPFPYQYCSVSLPFSRDVWVRAVDIRPGVPQVLHHAFVFLENPSLNRPAPDPRLFLPDPPPREADARGVIDFFATFLPDPQPFPDGTARFIPRGSRFVVQLHYAPNGRRQVDHPRVGLYLHRGGAPREFKVTSAFNTRFIVPARADDVQVEASRVFDRDVVLYGVLPHMHYRGSRVAFSVVAPDGEKRTVLSVPRYRMQWQNAYYFDPPLELSAGTRVDCTGAFDNSAANDANPDPGQPVKFGPESTDEMFIGYLLYSDGP